jgi:hypothetical protein
VILPPYLRLQWRCQVESKYDAMTRTEDAVHFAESPFGQHHLKRLRKQRERYLELSMNEDYTDSYRAHMATKASVYQKELDYFATAIMVKSDPKLMQRLKDKIFRKEADPDDEM